MKSQATLAPLLYVAFGGDTRGRNLPGEVMDELIAIAQVLPSQQPGERLFDQGGRTDRIYMARTGLLKGEVNNANGQRQVMDFYLAGDFLDIQSLFTLRHQCRVETITTATVISLPLREVLAIARHYPALQDGLHKAIGRELLKLDQVIYQLCRRPVGARIASFFLDLSERFQALGNEPRRFYFPARRADIASLLMMDRATFTRGFRELERDGLVTADGSEFRLLDPEGLRHLSLDDELTETRQARKN
ncbi:Crp/Fnr family transcriptional regulator [Ectothiorhodospiraceae bacterium WFHF3C12]|nr:Crp/Fnr family transcriptional regulator [Ectothiorhodospiraceae bacterium WFHF3C12]